MYTNVAIATCTCTCTIVLYVYNQYAVTTVFMMEKLTMKDMFRVITGVSLAYKPVFLPIVIYVYTVHTHTHIYIYTHVLYVQVFCTSLFMIEGGGYNNRFNTNYFILEL